MGIRGWLGRWNAEHSFERFLQMVVACIESHQTSLHFTNGVITKHKNVDSCDDACLFSIDLGSDQLRPIIPSESSFPFEREANALILRLQIIVKKNIPEAK